MGKSQYFFYIILNEMNILDLINKKKIGNELTEQEIDFFVNEYTIMKKIPDYQASALLMAMRINGLSTYETYFLTKAFVKYSNKYNYKKMFPNQILIDKHSSGGVGDKVSIILAPLLASLNYRVIKISGRGLGHTGGTIDKLESIKVNTNIDDKEFKKITKKSNCILMSQTEALVPSDKMIYALRDVTGTVDSLGLITASILSKKFVFDNDYIFIDLKVGSGALMKTKKDAIKLAKLMSNVAFLMNKTIFVVITAMDQALGRAIGNYIEIQEAVDFLQGKETSQDLKELIYAFMTEILIKTKKVGNILQAHNIVDDLIQSGKAYDYFINWTKAQGGSYKPGLYKPKYIYEIKAKSQGYVHYKDTKELGLIAIELGAGRHEINDKIDYSSGIYLNKKTNEKVKRNEVIATLYSKKQISRKTIERFNNNLEINLKPINKTKIIVKVI